jgi:hypothetical protein
LRQFPSTSVIEPDGGGETREELIKIARGAHAGRRIAANRVPPPFVFPRILITSYPSGLWMRCLNRKISLAVEAQRALAAALPRTS